MKSIPYCPVARKKRHRISTPKNEWKKYRPASYLYHLSNIGYSDEEDKLLNRLNIATEGICVRDKGLGGVWANNQIRNVNNLWPVWFDTWDCHTDMDYLEMLYQFNVWRIVTAVIKNTWYLDPNLIDGLEGSGDASDYLYCENTVHPAALHLFTLSINDYKILYEGKYNVVFELLPVNKTNECISFK